MGILELGLLGLAAYLFWGRKGGPAPGPVPDDGPTPSPRPTPDGRSRKWQGKPPNVSEDPAGYDTKRWPNGDAVCTALQVIGYTPSCATLGVGGSDGQVRVFQADYNKVAKNPDYGGIKGTLAVDGIAGKNTLNALDHVERLGYPWQYAVAGGPTG